VLPLPVTALTPVSDAPLAAAVKSETSTPVTLSEKVTVNCSLPPPLGLTPAGAIEETVGAV
jgi:hypothetical protein